MSKPANVHSIDLADHDESDYAQHARILALAAMIALAAVIAIGLALLIFVRPSNAAQSAPASAGKSATANADRGKTLFVSNGCYECHGRAAQGGVGPRLGPDPLPLAFIVKYVRHPTASMPPYTEKTVSDQELADIYAYLKSLPEPPKAKDIPLLNQ